MAPVSAPMAERSPEGALVSHEPSWRAPQRAPGACAMLESGAFPVVAIIIGPHHAHAGSAAG